jgi:hypothetical protein
MRRAAAHFGVAAAAAPELAERRIAMMRAIAERLEMGAPMLQSAAAHMAEKTK